MNTKRAIKLSQIRTILRVIICRKLIRFSKPNRWKKEAIASLLSSFLWDRPCLYIEFKPNLVSKQSMLMLAIRNDAKFDLASFYFKENKVFLKSLVVNKIWLSFKSANGRCLLTFWQSFMFSSSVTKQCQYSTRDGNIPAILWSITRIRECIRKLFKYFALIKPNRLSNSSQENDLKHMIEVLIAYKNARVFE